MTIQQLVEGKTCPCGSELGNDDFILFRIDFNSHLFSMFKRNCVTNSFFNVDSGSPSRIKVDFSSGDERFCHKFSHLLKGLNIWFVKICCNIWKHLNKIGG